MCCVCVCVHVHVSIWRVPISREFVRLGGRVSFKRTTACLANITDADITEVCCEVRKGFGRGYWGSYTKTPYVTSRPGGRNFSEDAYRVFDIDHRHTWITLCYNCYNYSRDWARIFRHGLFAARKCGEQSHVEAPVECVGRRTPPGCEFACR